MTRPPRNNETGAIAVLAAIVLIVVGAFLALSLNTGYKMDVKTGLSAAYDAAALAGVKELNGSAAGIALARQVAYDYARQHVLDLQAEQVNLNQNNLQDIVVGYWNPDNKIFYIDGSTVPFGMGQVITLSTTATPYLFNAVKVQATTDGAAGHNSKLEIFFGGFLGNSNRYAVGADAVAVAGGACEEEGCALAFAVPSCAMMENGGYVACGVPTTLRFNHSDGKDIAVISLAQSSPANNHTAAEENVLAQQCLGRKVVAGDYVSVQNGNDFNKKLDDSLRKPINMVCSAPAPYNGCLRRMLPIVDMYKCDKPMNQDHFVLGFARVVILDTNTGGKDASITVAIDCNGLSEKPGGCANFGYPVRNPRLVQWQAK